MGPALVALAHTSGTASTANVTTFNMVPTSSYTRSFCSPISRRSLIACVRITIWVHTFAFLISFCIPIPEEARTGLGLCRSNSDTLFYILTRLFLPTFLMLLVHCLSTILYIHYVASLSSFWPPSRRVVIGVLQLTASDTLVYLNTLYFLSSTSPRPLPSNPAMAVLREVTHFIPVSFAYEVVFDLLHYIAHRASHESQFLYQNIHKKHHTHASGVSWESTFSHHPFDLFFTNILPACGAAICVAPTVHQLGGIMVTKLFVELGGHLGSNGMISTPGSCSGFPQFIWLPKALGMEIYAPDHEAHHQHVSTNFSKRFILWDRVFGTYRAGKWRDGTPTNPKLGSSPSQRSPPSC